MIVLLSYDVLTNAVWFVSNAITACSIYMTFKNLHAYSDPYDFSFARMA